MSDRSTAAHFYHAGSPNCFDRYTCLIFNRNDTQTASEEFFHQIILLNVQGCSTKRGYSQRVVDLAPIRQTFHERLVTGLLEALRNLLHRPVQRFDLPMVTIGCSIEHLSQT